MILSTFRSAQSERFWALFFTKNSLFFRTRKYVGRDDFLLFAKIVKRAGFSFGVFWCSWWWWWWSWCWVSKWEMRLLGWNRKTAPQARTSCLLACAHARKNSDSHPCRRPRPLSLLRCRNQPECACPQALCLRRWGAAALGRRPLWPASKITWPNWIFFRNVSLSFAGKKKESSQCCYRREGMKMLTMHS